MVKYKKILSGTAGAALVYCFPTRGLLCVTWLLGIIKAADNTPTMHPFIYTSVYIMPILTIMGILGGFSWFTPIWIFAVIPTLEVIFNTKVVPPQHPGDAAANSANHVHWLYDFILYGAIPVQGIMLLLLLSAPTVSTMHSLGMTISAGLCCGALGINVAHELGHRRSVADKRWAKVLLSMCMYAHWHVEHTHGHHKNVGTDADPATSRRDEWLYSFWWRSVKGGFLSALRIDRKRGSYEVIQWLCIEAGIVAFVQLTFGFTAVIRFLLSSLVAVLLLETVNYIEHYGLRRKVSERVVPQHSWNSSNVVSRMFLFELSHHSDHHAHPRKPYSKLTTQHSAPQFPMGYGGMVLLSFFPPLFFALMNPRIPDDNTRVSAGAKISTIYK